MTRTLMNAPASSTPPGAIADALWTREDVGTFFSCKRTATYDIAGLENCRVAIPGSTLVRFDPAKVRALINPKRRQR